MRGRRALGTAVWPEPLRERGRQAALRMVQPGLGRMHVCLLSRFSHVQLCDHMSCCPPGSSVHGTLQARTLEWVAISFSRILKKESDKEEAM